MITVFGSINVDLVTAVERLPEPGETVLGGSYTVVPGGKGANQALAAARAGARVCMIGGVGDDGFASIALATLRTDGVDLAHVARRTTPTGCAMIAVARSGDNQIVVASGANRDTVAAQLLESDIGHNTLLLQMEVPHEENWRAVREARARVARIVLNVAPAGAVPVAALDDIDVLVMNRPEAARVARDLGLGRDLGPSGDEPLTLARALAMRHGVTAIVTLGADGSVAATNEGDWRLGALAVDVVDTTAAGDAFVGVLAAGLDAAQPIEAALHRASVAGGLACRKQGAQPSLPWAADIDAALARLSPPKAIAPA